LTSINKKKMNPIQNELQRNLITFLYLSKQQPFDVVCKSAIYLLQNLPSSRHSILEYFNTLFELATVLPVNKNTSNQDDVNNLYEVIDEIQQVLINLVKSEAWSFELFDWSIELIATSSKKYEHLVIKVPQQQQLSIIDSLHSWTQCKPIRNLLEIAQICINESKNKTEIFERLLNFQYKNGTNTDWLICHLGSLCANEAILCLLVLGFREFLNQQQQLVKSSASIIKFNSIINILNYFTNLYSQYVCILLTQIFQNFLKGDYEYFKQYFSCNSDQVKQLTISYLIQLASLSPNIFYIMSYNIKETLNPVVIENIYLQTKQMLNFDARNSLFMNLKLLLRQFTANSNEFLMYLMDLTVDNQLDEDARKTARCFIQAFLDDLNSFVLTNSKETIPIIESLRKDFKLLVNLLLNNTEMNELKKKWLLNIIILIGIQGPSYITNSIMSKMLVTKHYDIGNLIKYRQEIDIFDANCTTYSIESVIKVLKANRNYYSNEQIYVNDQTGIDFTLNENCLDSFLGNLIELHNWDVKNEHSGNNIDKILCKSDLFIDLIRLLDNNISTIINIFIKIGLPGRLNVDECLIFSFHLVKYFFKIIEIENDRVKQISELENIKQMIKISCLNYNDVLRNILLRTLVDYFFEQTKFYNFQTKKTIVLCDKNNNNQNADFDLFDDKYVSMYEQNLYLNKHLPLTKLRAKIPLVENFNRNGNKLTDKQVNILFFCFFFIY
jgi:hypothetical protein